MDIKNKENKSEILESNPQEQENVEPKSNPEVKKVVRVEDSGNDLSQESEVKESENINAESESDISDLDKLDAENKLKKLLALVKSKSNIEEGFSEAIKIAEKMDDPFLLDALHDKLAEEKQNKEKPN
ncbi:MAG: hypothetical protein FJZ43_01050 [Candidatus Staskawiczbacteria bacterium]|nr:hypothetical protein [Candidatus Staskawiczbacteria bacterium]